MSAHRTTARILRFAFVAVFLAVVTAPIARVAAKGGAAPKSAKLDKALQAVVDSGASEGTIQIIIRVKPGGHDTIATGLTNHGDQVLADHPSIDSISAEVHQSDLVELANHPAVDGLSLNA